MPKAAFNYKSLFISGLGVNLRENRVKCTLGAWLSLMLKLGNFENQIRNTWKVLCGAGEDWRRSVGPNV